MPNDPESNRLPAEALDAFFEGVLKDLKDPVDLDALNQVRAAFRRRIPLHLRSYAAALLILRAAGLSRPSSSAPAPVALSRASNRPARDAGTASLSGKSGLSGKPAAMRRKEPETAKNPDDGRRKPPRPAEPGRAAAAENQNAQARVHVGPIGPVAPLFVSMGKRQRMKPAELRALITEKTGIPSDNLGRVRLFDNYCFIDVPEAEAPRIVAAVDGSEIHGRPIEVKPAKKRGEEAPTEA
ncbi:MAG: DbpA RNA binding domain-containing protein [Rectinemataceae bacterium]